MRKLERIKRWIKRGWEAFCWVVTRVVGLAVIATVLFAVWQPFVWGEFGTSAPVSPIDTQTLAALMALVVALLALGGGVFAFLAYQVLQHRLRESLGEEIRTESRSALTRAVGNIAFGLWRTWRINSDDLELIKGSITSQSWALDLVEGLKPTEILSEERRLQMKSNIAGYTAYMGKHFRDKVKPEDLENAMKKGREAYERAKDFGGKYDWKANYAGLLAIFGTSEEKKLATQIKVELQERHNSCVIPDAEWQEYCELLGELD